LLLLRHIFALIPNDPGYVEQWYMDMIGAPRAWELTTGSSSVVVNINDSGIDYLHPELYLNIWLNQKEIPFRIGGDGLRDTDDDTLITFWDLNAKDSAGAFVNRRHVSDLNGTGLIDAGDLLADPRWENGRDDGGNGLVDDLVGWDFANGDNDPMDDYFHGTGVAGFIGTVGNNGAGGAGLNWRVQLMATKGIDADGSWEDDSPVVAGIYYAVDNGARITNNSWGHFPASVGDPVYAGIDYARSKGVLWVASAGNNNWDNDKEGPHQSFPSSFDLPNIISVAATDDLDHRATFGKTGHSSSYGLTSVDLAAPGDAVVSTYPTALTPEGLYPAALYFGSSFAAPLVAGAAALLLARNPNLTYAQLKSLIMDNVDPIKSMDGRSVTGGRLNVYKALAATPLPGASAFNNSSISFEPTPSALPAVASGENDESAVAAGTARTPSVHVGLVCMSA
jgi:serine protease